MPDFPRAPGRARGRRRSVSPLTPSPRAETLPGTGTSLPTPGRPGSGPGNPGGCHRPARPSRPRPATAAFLPLPAPSVCYLLGAGGCSMAVGAEGTWVGGESGREERSRGTGQRSPGTTQGNSRNSEQLSRNSAADPPPAPECGSSRTAPPLSRRSRSREGGRSRPRSWEGGRSQALGNEGGFGGGGKSWPSYREGEKNEEKLKERESKA